MKVKNIFICIFFMISPIFVACSNTNATNLDSKNMQNSKYFYGEGSGSTFDAAKAEAIKDIATNLQVSVKYNSLDSTRQQGEMLTTTGFSNVALESQIKDLPAIEVTKSSKKDNIFTIKVRLEKSILQNQILNRINSSQNLLESMLETCKDTSFTNHNKFIQTLKDYKKDVFLYQIITKNSAYGSAILLEYNAIANALPRYQVNITFKDENIINNDIKNIIYAELSKFIKIDNDASKILNINVNNSDVAVLYLNFYDCANKLESSLKIDTFLHYSDLSSQKSQKRFAAIFYKNLKT